MTVETWISTLQHEAPDALGARRRLTPDEVHQRALTFRPGWLACELDRPGDEELIAEALAANPGLDDALAPRLLDPGRIGIAVDAHLLSRLAAALPDKPDSIITDLRQEHRK